MVTSDPLSAGYRRGIPFTCSKHELKTTWSGYMTDTADLSTGRIKNKFAQSEAVYTRGERLFFLGNYVLTSEEKNIYRYNFNGNYGDYTVDIELQDDEIQTSCSCPFPHKGCKHAVAALLDIRKRRERARKEGFSLLRRETLKGEHIVLSPKGARYTVTIYDPLPGREHCTCPDFRTNHLDLCKHLVFTEAELKKEKDFGFQVGKETFPFAHFTWSTVHENPCCYFETLNDETLEKRLRSLFSEKGIYTRESMGPLFKLYQEAPEDSPLRFDEHLLNRMEEIQYRKELIRIAEKTKLDFSFLKTALYPYQREGVEFAVFRKAAVIADEMGLGKTLQAIATAILKSRIFGFSKVLIVSPSSLKEQWKREIEKYTDESVRVVSGPRALRHRILTEDEAFFKISNYEAVLRDVTVLSRWKPDLIILDEAQRIKNFETKTHQALLSIPHTHSLVITGTPLENKLEDVYSIAQFSDPKIFTPLWAFAANYYNLDKQRRKIVGYRNLDTVREKLKDLVIRRRKEDVFSDLPERIDNTYFLDMTAEQEEIHQGLLFSLLPILNKKVLTPMDIKRMQMILLSMRMVCDSTYLIDKETNISPKLTELVPILKEIVVENRRKAIIFSEWTTMTYLIGKVWLRSSRKTRIAWFFFPPMPGE
jgi:superfamily II DNA or RNA helicase